MLIQQAFAYRVADIIKEDPGILGLAVAGSWADQELDEYSDLDLVLVTREKIGGDRKKMTAIARGFGEFISGFTGEHVGEPRLLICLYDNPLLHVDIKFVTAKEFETRVDDPVVLFERNQRLSKTIQNFPSQWPEPELQWIEDRFWTWVHYIAGRIGRGEFFEALSNLDYLRMQVLAPMMHRKNQKKSRGLRKVEKRLTAADLENLKITVTQYHRDSLIKGLDNAISVYRSLRRKLAGEQLELQTLAEKKAMSFFRQLKEKDD